jgi:hypothetical protein
MKQLYKFILIFFILLKWQSVIAQDNKLKISGSVFAEKSSVKDIRIVIIEIKNQSNDTIQIIKVIPTKNPTTGNFNIELILNKQYKIIFEGDTNYQETRYFDISTKIDEDIKPKDYFIKELKVQVWIGRRTKKEGEIIFDNTVKEFQILRTE